MTGRRDDEKEEEETAGAEKGAGAVGFGFFVLFAYISSSFLTLYLDYTTLYSLISSSLSSSLAEALPSCTDAY